MASTLSIFRGDTFGATVNLRQTDDANSAIVNPYPIATGSTIEVRFPGETSTVILSTANAGEVTVVDSDLSTITFLGSPTKSALLKLGTQQSIDVVITTLAGKVTTFEKTKVLTVKDRAN